MARARGAELEREWPFGIARQLLEPVLRRRSAEERAELLEGAAALATHVVLPELADAAVPVDVSFGALHGLYWLSANLATRRPLLLAVDDAQWADDASVRFLGVLARRLDGLPVVVLLAQRPAPELLAELVADPETDRLRIQPLSPAAVERFLQACSPGPVDPEFASACQAATGGNPFLLSRLAPGLRDAGVAFTAANRDRVTDAGADAVRDAVGATLARLPAAAVALAEAVAVLGDDVERSLAAMLAGVDEPAAETAAEELARAGVLADVRPLRFLHAIVRDAVVSRLSAGVRSALHAQAAELLAARHASLDAIAGHLLAVEPRGRDWVVDQLGAAARQALAAGSPETALKRLQRALEEPPREPLRAELELDLARAKSAFGHNDALDHFRAAYALTSDPMTRARAVLELTWAAGPAVDLEHVLPQLERAIGDVQGDRELTLELEAARYAALSLSPARLTERWEAGYYQPFTTLEGSTAGERLLLAQLALAQLHAGGPADVAADFAERAAGDEPLGAGMSLMFALIVLMKTDRLDVAERVLERELGAARRCGSLTAYALVCNFRGAVAARRGALAAADADLRAGLEALPRGDWQRPQLMAGIIDILVESGAHAEAQALLVAAGWDADMPDGRSHTVLLGSRSRLRVAQGEPRQALTDALAARRRMGGESVNWDGLARVALLHHALGDSERARHEADAFLVSARRWGTPGAIGQALHTSGVVQGGEAGLALMQAAIEQLERSPARLQYAYALVDYGAALRRRGDRADAREPLRRGLDVAAACGANPLAERARQELSATGLRIRRDAQTGVAALTPSERRIAEHAAGGSTNPQIAQALFITVKTVEMHLGNAYRKLDITSRQQLAGHLDAVANA